MSKVLGAQAAFDSDDPFSGPVDGASFARLDTVDLGALHRAGVRLGLSTHSYWEVCRAWALRPSYIACGPIFATQSKDMPWIPQGLDNLRYWAGVLPVPVVGIAGIGVAQMADVAAQGVAGASALAGSALEADELPPLKSVAYQPLPLSWKPAAESSLL